MKETILLRRPHREPLRLTAKQYARWLEGSPKVRRKIERQAERLAREVSAPMVVADIFAERTRPVRKSEPSRARKIRGAG